MKIWCVRKYEIYMFVFPEFLLRIIKRPLISYLDFFKSERFLKWLRSMLFKNYRIKNTLYMFCFVICLFVCVFVKLQDPTDLTVLWLSFYQQAVNSSKHKCLFSSLIFVSIHVLNEKVLYLLNYWIDQNVIEFIRNRMHLALVRPGWNW